MTRHSPAMFRLLLPPRLLVPVALCLITAACDDGRPPMAPVTGRVTMDGAAVEGATVLFYAADGGSSRPGAGTTDGDGEFRVTTWTPGDGGLIGSHRVTVSKAINPTAEQPGNVFPLDYTDKSATPLRVDVTESGDNRFEFAITSP